MRFETNRLPNDLRDSISDSQLAQCVEEAVGNIAPADVEPTNSWKIILGIFAYSYATGRFLSDEIAESLNNTPAAASWYKSVFRNTEPSAVLRAFRRVNRAAVEECLAQVLRLACSNDDCPPTNFQEEANNRVNRAIEADCWALDGN